MDTLMDMWYVKRVDTGKVWAVVICFKMLIIIIIAQGLFRVYTLWHLFRRMLQKGMVTHCSILSYQEVFFILLQGMVLDPLYLPPRVVWLNQGVYGVFNAEWKCYADDAPFLGEVRFDGVSFRDACWRRITFGLQRIWFLLGSICVGWRQKGYGKSTCG